MSADPTITPELPLSFHRLTFVADGAEVLVGRAGTDSYAVLPPDGAEALKRMMRGDGPGEVAAWYEETYGELLDIEDFVASMSELGFLLQPGETADAADPPVRLQRLARAAFSLPAFMAYGLVIVAWVVAMSNAPSLVPRPQHVFFSDSAMLVQLLIVFGQIPWLLLHEGAHVLAGRKLGLPSELGFGTRLYFVVFETRMPSLLSVPRRQRYLAFIAGMLLDVLAICGLGLLAYALRGSTGMWHTVYVLALAMAFPIFTRFAYQFLLFLQTDVYYIAATALGCYDLHAATRTLVANRLWRVIRRPERARPVSDWTERDLRVARWYAPFFAVGVTVMLAVWVFALIPIMTGLVHIAAQALSAGASDARFWDATLFIVLNVAQIAFFAYLALRNRARGRKEHAPAAAPIETGAFS
jgi:hypothetical protein